MSLDVYNPLLTIELKAITLLKGFVYLESVKYAILSFHTSFRIPIKVYSWKVSLEVFSVKKLGQIYSSKVCRLCVIKNGSYL